MNHEDDFEKKLLALTASLRRPDPTPAWKADILSRARREAQAAAPALAPAGPPRWLSISWVAAWAAILVLWISMPRDSLSGAGRDSASASSRHTAPGSFEFDPAPQTLFAFHQRMTLNPDLP